MPTITLVVFCVCQACVFFMQPVALRLVCHGDAARCESAVYPNSGPFIQCLTQSASFHTTGLNFLVDGQHEAGMLQEVTAGMSTALARLSLSNFAFTTMTTTSMKLTLCRLRSICLKRQFFSSTGIATLLPTALR